MRKAGTSSKEVYLAASTRTFLLISFEHPLGIGYSTGTTHSALYGIRCKVIDAVMFLNADFGKRNVQQGKCSASKSAVLSLFLSLHKQRKKIDKQTKRKERIIAQARRNSCED